MSWLSGLAGKAEALLNQVDQAASDSLKEAGFSTPQKEIQSNTIVTESLSYEPSVLTTKPGQRGVVAQALVGTTPRTSVVKKEQINERVHTIAPRTSSVSSSLKSSVPSDDKLFEFLNSPSQPKTLSPSRLPSAPISHSTKKTPLPTSKSVPLISSHQPPLSNVMINEVTSPVTTAEKQVMNTQQEIIHPPVESEHIDEDADTKVPDNAPLTMSVTESIDGLTEHEQPLKSDTVSEEPAMTEKPTNKKELDSLKQTISNYKLENKLLKREINSLNEELVSIMSKLSGQEEKEAVYESEIHALREQASRTDHMIRQLRSHDEDLQASLEARDSQIGVLRARLSEADRKVEEQQKQLAGADSEKER